MWIQGFSSGQSQVKLRANLSHAFLLGPPQDLLTLQGACASAVPALAGVQLHPELRKALPDQVSRLGNKFVI